MAGKMTMKTALKKVEKSAADKKRDARPGAPKEGSKADMASDRKQAKSMMKKKGY